MTKASLDTFAQQHGRSAEVESLLYFPHPFTDGGIIVVYQDDVRDFLGSVADVYATTPPTYSLRCLRKRELFQLSLPGLFAPPLQVNEQPHLLYWLNHKGVVLAGKDLRSAVMPQTDPKILLAGHIEGCMDYLRRYGVLMSLIHGKDEALAAMLAQEVNYLMGTALLLHGIWDISLATVADQFAEAFAGTRPLQIQQQLQANVNGDILETVWHFEQFLRSLRELAS
ncbi:hypothetical protein [Candidatus Leptofilum sp.]|uniref:hypothetical protein n=1 Tax=Candidatus Leptofilum sp. TaxID=3241576 RepID=UPI003B59D728